MSVLAFSLIGSILILDKYAFAETGLSQPIMVGTLLGIMTGDVGSGILTGAVLQLIFLGGLPIGRDIPPDGQTGGFIGCATFFLVRAHHPAEHALTVALLFALISSIMGGALEIITRRLNGFFAQKYTQNRTHLTFYHFVGLLTAFIRGAVIITLFCILAHVVRIPADFPTLSYTHFISIGVGIGMANALYLFFKKTTIPYIVIGGLCGLVLLVL